jgi:hypothetical protein
LVRENGGQDCSLVGERRRSVYESAGDGGRWLVSGW